MSRSLIQQLVRELNGTTDEHEGALEALRGLGREGLGHEIVPPVVAALDSLSTYGKLGAIDLLGDLRDERSVPALIECLADDDWTVRGWAADALGNIPGDQAVEPLQAALDRCDAPPDWSEPVSLRCALDRLGSRHRVLPEKLARIRVPPDGKTFPGHGMYAFPAKKIRLVLIELTDAHQLPLYVQLWTPNRRWGFIGDDCPRFEWASPASRSDDDWNTAVRRTRDIAVAAFEGFHPPRKAIANVEWIGHDDMPDLTLIHSAG